MNHKDYFIKGELAALGILLIAALCLAAPDTCTAIWAAVKSGHMDAVADVIRAQEDKALLFSFLLTVIVSAIGFPPAMLFSAANTLLFGVVPGILLSWVAETVGAALSFWILRGLLRPTAERLIAKEPRLAAWDAKSADRGLRIMFLARLIPYFPAAALNAFGALSRMRFSDYLIGSFLGKFPSTALEALIGHDILTIGQHPHRLFALVVLVSLLYGAFLWYDRTKKSRTGSLPSA